MTAQRIRFTRREYDRLPEGFPAELIDGCLVSEPAPVPWHQVLVSRLRDAVVPATAPDRVLVSPVDLPVDEWNVLQPDVVVLRDAVKPKDRHIGLPLIAMEVLSPSTAARDRNVKARTYLRAGVEEVWIVDPDRHLIEVRSGRGSRTAGPGERVPSTALPNLDVSLDELFRG